MRSFHCQSLAVIATLLFRKKLPFIMMKTNKWQCQQLKLKNKKMSELKNTAILFFFLFLWRVNAVCMLEICWEQYLRKTEHTCCKIYRYFRFRLCIIISLYHLSLYHLSYNDTLKIPGSGYNGRGRGLVYGDMVHLMVFYIGTMQTGVCYKINSYHEMFLFFMCF